MPGSEDVSSSITHHSDHPTLIDELNRFSSVAYKAEQIINCMPPQVFGIHGDWGAGKTSYLRQLRYHLDGSAINSDN